MKYRDRDMIRIWIRLIVCSLVLFLVLGFAGNKALVAGQHYIEKIKADRVIAAARKESEAEARSTEAAKKESQEAEEKSTGEAAAAESMNPEDVYQDYLKDDDLTYFINNCDSKDFEYGDISGFDQTVCRLALNGIYARSGREFKDEALTVFYNDFSWYHPTISPDSFTNSMFNDHQSNNRDMLLKYMKEKGYR